MSTDKRTVTIGVPAAPSTTSVTAVHEVKSGWLLKLGGKGILANWKRRWFRLYSDRTIMYFKSVTDLHPLGIIELGNSPVHTISEHGYKAVGKKKNAIEIATPRRMWYLVAGSYEEMREWVDAIKRVQRGGRSKKKAGAFAQLHQQMSRMELNLPSMRAASGRGSGGFGRGSSMFLAGQYTTGDAKMAILELQEQLDREEAEEIAKGAQARVSDADAGKDKDSDKGKGKDTAGKEAGSKEGPAGSSGGRKSSGDVGSSGGRGSRRSSKRGSKRGSKRASGGIMGTLSSLFSSASRTSSGPANEFGVDIPAAAEELMYFLEGVDGLSVLANPAVIRRAIQRYFMFVKLQQAYPDQILVPPVDVEMVWQSHMMRPVQYHEELTEHGGRVLDHAVVVPAAVRKSNLAATERLWIETYPKDQFMQELDYVVDEDAEDGIGAEDVKQPAARRVEGVPFSITVADVQQDRRFFSAFCDYCDDQGIDWDDMFDALESSMSKYKKLLTASSEEDRQALLNPFLELAWRAHLLHPMAYLADCRKLAKDLVDHAPFVAVGASFK